MGRFSKLETGAGEGPEKEPGEGPFGLHLKPRRRGSDEDTGTSVDYDQGHYLAEGHKYFYSGDYQKAMRAYSRAMQVDHSAIDPWVGQVLSLIMLKQNREAAMWALRGTELFPEDARLVSLQGLTLALTGARQRAISCSDFAMSRPNGGTPFAWAMRGQILSLCENPNAGFCLQKVEETRDPGDWQILATVGEFLLAQRKWARAIDFLRPAVEIQPGNGWLWKRLGLAYEHLAFTQKAMNAYNCALEINPNDKEATECIRRLTSVPITQRIWRRFQRGKA